MSAFPGSNLDRQRLLPIPKMPSGRIYRSSIPWYNRMAWTAIVDPPATLALAPVGIGRVVAGRFRDRVGTPASKSGRLGR